MNYLFRSECVQSAIKVRWQQESPIPPDEIYHTRNTQDPQIGRILVSSGTEATMSLLLAKTIVFLFNGLMRRKLLQKLIQCLFKKQLFTVISDLVQLRQHTDKSSSIQLKISTPSQHRHSEFFVFGTLWFSHKANVLSVPSSFGQFEKHICLILNPCIITKGKGIISVFYSRIPGKMAMSYYFQCLCLI